MGRFGSFGNLSRCKDFERGIMKAVSYWVVDALEHEGTKEVVCPHCSYEYPASWEFDEEGIEECAVCGGKFRYERNVSVTYTTQKDCELNEEEHDWKPFGNDGVFRCTKCGKMGLNVKEGDDGE